MKCPLCKKELKKIIFYGPEVDQCPKCHGLWFEHDELRRAKDKKEKDLLWLDIELWKVKTKFKISPLNKLCPSCGVPLYEVTYGDSDIKVDFCNLCRGIWLDKGEFLRIIDYLKKKSSHEILERYTENLVEEFGEIFLGPESPKEEVRDLLMILSFLKYKLAIQRPFLSQMILWLPK